MKITDTHCHLYNETFRTSISKWLDKWKTVKAIIVTAMDLDESRGIVEYCKDIGIAYPGIGIHPWNVQSDSVFDDFEEISTLIPKTNMIGEIGLDYHFVEDSNLFPLQRKVFERFLQLSKDNDLPTTIHTTGAEDDVLEIIQTSGIDPRLISIHWYSGPEDTLKSLIDHGIYFSIGPAVSYSSHRRVAQLVPEDRLLTESDGDVKYRGKLGHPGMIDEVISEIAKIRDVDEKELSEQIFDNFISFTGLKEIRL